jgi:uncharacterized protein
MTKIIFTSDLHGNDIQYRKLIEYSNKIKAEYLIIGGDIAPKNFFSMRSTEGQRGFLENLKHLFENCSSKVLLMLGNDDFSINADVLQNQKEFSYLHNERHTIGDFEILGYSFVPITPFQIKDWEKYDLTNVPKNYELESELLLKTVRKQGRKSGKNGFIEFEFKDNSDSIQNDLNTNLFLSNPKKTIYVFHAPPYGTNLDKINPTMHVGSIAIRLFIEEQQPYLTLHGHIHETVDVSGCFIEEIGNTISMSAGNHNQWEKLAVLVFDIDDPSKAERLIL